MKHESIKFTAIMISDPTKHKAQHPIRSSDTRWLWRNGLGRVAFIVLTALLVVANLAGHVHGQSKPSQHRLTIEGIEIVGNTKTSEDVFYRYLTIGPGDPITPEVIELNNRRLSQTNFFKDVEFYTRRGSQKGKVVVIIEVKERKWPYFQFEGGRSDLDGWFFVPASLRFDNAFGHGSKLGLKLTIGDRLGLVSLWYHNASLFNNRAFVDVQLLGGSQDFIHYFGNERFEQTVEFSGLQAKLGGTRGLLRHLFVAYRLRNYDPDDFAIGEESGRLDTLPPGIADDLVRKEYESLIFGITADRRDNPVFPLRGFWGAVTVQSASQRNSDVKFSKLLMDVRFFQKTTRTHVFALHLKGGYTPAQTPFFERFYLGGANSLRGYQDRRLTPVGWGTKFVLASAEYRFPLSERNFPYHKTSGVLFFDTGGIWSPGQTPELSDFYGSVGFGVRVKLPIVGTTRFDWAFPLRRVDGEKMRFHISLGHSF